MTLSTLLISTPQKNLAAVLFLTVFITAVSYTHLTLPTILRV